MPDGLLSQALKEAYASAKGVIYHTLELRHPSFSSPIRVVRDYSDLTAGLEASAPSNPNEYVLFTGFAFDFTKPEISTSGVPQMSIVIDNVSREIVANIELALTSTDLVKATYREYISTDLSIPQNNPPVHMDIMSVSATLFQVTAVAGFPNLMNRKFPTKEYSTEEFPALV